MDHLKRSNLQGQCLQVTSIKFLSSSEVKSEFTPWVANLSATGARQVLSVSEVHGGERQGLGDCGKVNSA